jgi:hypothetical protein
MNLKLSPGTEPEVPRRDLRDKTDKCFLCLATHATTAFLPIVCVLFMYLPSPFLIILFTFHVSFPALEFPYSFSRPSTVCLLSGHFCLPLLLLPPADKRSSDGNNRYKTQKTVLTRRSKMYLNTCQ